MAFVVGHARVACDTSTGNQAITITWADGGSHTPTAAEFRAIRASADATNTAHQSISLGAATSTTARWCIANHSEDNASTTDTDIHSRNESCVALIDPSDSSLEANADFVSFGSDTVTIDWTTAPATGYYLHVIAYAGTDAVACGSFTPSGTDAGTVDVTTLGESANYVLLGGSHPVTGFNEANSVNERIFSGFYSWDGSTARQASIRYIDRNAQATSYKGVAWSNTLGLLVSQNSSLGVEGGIALSNHASGFTATSSEWGTLTSAATGYLALALPAGVDAYVGTIATKTTTGTQADTNPGFTPQALTVIGTHADAASTDSSTNEETTSPDADGISFGTAISVASQISISICSHDGQSTSDTNSRSDNGKVATVLTGSGTVAIQADLDSFDATGFTLDFTTTNGTARNWPYVAFESDGVAGVSVTQDAAATATATANDATITTGAVSTSQDATAASTAASFDATITVGSVSTAQDAPASSTTAAYDATITVGSVSTTQDAAAALSVAAYDATVSIAAAGAQTATQDAAASLSASAYDSTITVGSVTTTQDAAAASSATAYDATITATITTTQDATVSLSASVFDATITVGSVTTTQDAPAALTAAAYSATVTGGTIIDTMTPTAAYAPTLTPMAPYAPTLNPKTR